MVPSIKGFSKVLNACYNNAVIIVRHLVASSCIRITYFFFIVAFYQGQYSKAIIKWQEQAIFGNDTEKNLLRISDLFCELGCFHELAIFVTWVFANFHKEVITKILLFTSHRGLRAI